MCGRFTQYRTREEYLKEFADEVEREIAYDPEPIARYNVAPGTNVLLLNQRDDSLHLDPVHWGYGPEWWHKAPLINARVETAATGRMFKPLWNNGRAIVMADGWYEWKRDDSKKQPYFIYHKSGKPIFFAVIGKVPYDKQNESEGFVIVTAASDKGLVDIHDRRPLVLSTSAVLDWLNPETTSEEAQGIAKEQSIPSDEFTWHPVSKSVGSVKNHGSELVEEIDDPVL
ncbi:SOS response-associated peptidase family protein [Erwinia sp. HDF1-3R]|uniref:SOS response-associated peptidase family protein n=1 Tax=Erwinia sp. HDF1-3R TaxID=3141543 RepID=UPI0031F4D8F4